MPNRCTFKATAGLLALEPVTSAIFTGNPTISLNWTMRVAAALAALNTLLPEPCALASFAFILVETPHWVLSLHTILNNELLSVTDANFLILEKAP